jgi:hypothetical protein
VQGVVCGARGVPSSAPAATEKPSIRKSIDVILWSGKGFVLGWYWARPIFIKKCTGHVSYEYKICAGHVLYVEKQCTWHVLYTHKFSISARRHREAVHQEVDRRDPIKRFRVQVLEVRVQVLGFRG